MQAGGALFNLTQTRVTLNNHPPQKSDKYQTTPGTTLETEERKEEIDFQGLNEECDNLDVGETEARLEISKFCLKVNLIK